MRAIIDLGQRLQLTTVAEGIETPEQAGFLTGAGCRLAQGYYFCRPLSAAQVPDYLRTSGTPLRRPAVAAVPRCRSNAARHRRRSLITDDCGREHDAAAETTFRQARSLAVPATILAYGRGNHMRKLVGYLTVCVSVGVLAPMAFASRARGRAPRASCIRASQFRPRSTRRNPGDTVLVESGTYARASGSTSRASPRSGKGAKLVPPPKARASTADEGGVISDGICIFAEATPAQGPADSTASPCRA